MSLMLIPTAISQPGPQVSTATSTSTSTSDQKANDAVSFGDLYKHSLASGGVNAAVAKVSAPALDKTPVRAPVRHQTDGSDGSAQNPAAALLFAMMPATPAAANPATAAASAATTGSSLPTTAETQLNQAIAAAGGQNGGVYTPPATAGKAPADNAGSNTADKLGANMAATPVATPPIAAVTPIAVQPTSPANAQKQGQQALPAANGSDATTLAAVSSNAVPAATASDTGSAQQHGQREHTKGDTQISQPEAAAAPATTLPSSVTQTIATAAETNQQAATQLNQISPGALLALNPTPPAPAVIAQPVIAPAPISLPLTPQVGSSEWAGALSQQVIFMGNANHQVAELHLNPPDLGPLKVTLTMSDNQAQAIFVSGHESVRAAVEAALPQLRTNLADSGISLGHTSVSADTPQQQSAFTQNQSGQSAQRNSQRFSANVAANSTPLASTPSVSTSLGAIDTFA